VCVCVQGVGARLDSIVRRCRHIAEGGVGVACVVCVHMSV